MAVITAFGKSRSFAVQEQRDLDRKIIKLQQSTKTTFRIFTKPHNYLRTKSKHYYNWHLFSHANKIHISTATIAMVLAFTMIFNMFLPQTRAATYTKTWTTQSDWETGTTRSQVDTAASAGNVVLAANPSPAMTYNSMLGTSGTGNGQFTMPTGVTTDSSGNIYIADAGNNRIQKFNSSGVFQWWLGYNGSTIGTHTTGTGTSGSGDGQFNSPRSVTLDVNGNIYVADLSNNRVQVFQSDGTFIRKFGSYGTENGQFNQPIGIDLDSSGNIYVVEFSGYRVQVFQSDGTFIRKFGSYGTGNGQFYDPAGIVLDNSDNVYVTDLNNNRVQKFNSAGTFQWWLGYDGATYGLHTDGVGVDGSGDGQLSAPRGINIDSSGNIYVTESTYNVIQVFNSDGTFIRKFGATGSGNGQFSTVNEVGLNPGNDLIYIADRYNNRVQILNNALAYYASGTVSDLTQDAGGKATWSKISWNGNFPTGTSVKYQVKTSDDNVNWSAWSGYYTDTEEPYEVSLSVADSEYISIEMTLQGGLNTPTISDLALTYVINSSPVVSNVTASQGSGNLVSVAYDVTDPDTNTGTVRLFYNDSVTNTAQEITKTSPANTESLSLSATTHLPTSGTLQIGSEYISYTGKTVNSVTGITRAALSTKATVISNSTSVWAHCATTTGTGSKNTGTGTNSYTATWNPTTDLDEVYLINALKIRVSFHDGELANMVGYGDSSALAVFDTKDPVAGAIGDFTGIKIADGASWTNDATPDLTLSSSDDTVLTMMISNDNFATGSYETYATSKTGWALSSSDGNKTVYVRFKDAYGNTTDTSTTILLDTTAPDMPIHFTIFDASDMQLGTYQIIAAWNTVNNPGDFLQYSLERSTGSGWAEIATFSNISSDVYSDKGLSNSLTYSYRLRAKDIHTNASAYTDIKSLEPAGVDTIAPEITGTGPTPEAQDVTATISWTTDKPSDSYVEYGTTTAYGQMQGADDLLVNHIVSLVGLNPTTTYQFRVKCRDASGNRVVSDNASFTTTLPAESASGVNITGSTAQKPGADPEEVTIIWTTDRYSTSAVKYGTNEDNLDMITSEDPTLNKTHYVNVSHLNANTKYYYQAYSKDTYGNEVLGEMKYFVTAQSGLATPTIASVKVTDITLTSAIISWETTTVATSVVEIGDTAGVYTNHIEDQSTGSTTKHLIRVPELTSGKEYHFRVLGEGSDGRWIASDDYLFSTIPLPVISDIQVRDVASTTAIISWKTNIDIVSTVSFGIEKLDESQGDATLSTDHITTLKALAPAKSYNFQIRATDSFGNVASSGVQSFSTIVDTTAPVIKDMKSEVSITTDSNGESKAQAIVSWSTDEPATSQVKYSLGVVAADDYPLKTQEETGLTTSHVVIISNLQPSATYHMRLLSKDSSGNLAVTDDYSVITLNQQKTLLEYIVQILQNRFSWISNVGFLQ